MPRRQGDEQPDPPGGRAAERRRAFLAGRFPAGEPPSPPAETEAEPRSDEDEPEAKSTDEREDEPEP